MGSSSVASIMLSCQVTLVVKNPPARAGNVRAVGSVPGRKIPWRKAQQPTLVFLPGEPHGQRSLSGSGPQGHTQSDTIDITEHSARTGSFDAYFLKLFFFLIINGC